MYLDSTLPTLEHPTELLDTQSLNDFEANVVAKIENILNAQLFVENLSKIPPMLKLLYKRVKTDGGDANVKTFWNFVGPLSLGNSGIQVNIRIPISSTTPKYILAEIKVFADELLKSDSQNKYRSTTSWFQTATMIDKQFQSILSTDENAQVHPWKNTAASFKELQEDALAANSYFQQICDEVASQAGSIVSYDPEDEGIRKRKIQLVELQATTNLQPKSNYSKATIFKVAGIAACLLGCGLISAMLPPIKNEYNHEPTILKTNPHNCLCDHPSMIYPPVDTNINDGITTGTPPNPACEITISPFLVEFNDFCSKEERGAAYAKKNELTKAYLDEVDQRAARNASDNEQIAQQEIDVLIAQREVFILNWKEKLRKLTNPTPEELAKLYEEIDCELDERFRGWAGYTSTCKTKKRLDICDSLHAEYIKFAKQYHPDKNKSPEALSKFLKAAEEYEARCPPKAQEFR